MDCYTAGLIFDQEVLQGSDVDQKSYLTHFAFQATMKERCVLGQETPVCVFAAIIVQSHMQSFLKLFLVIKTF